MPRKDRRWTMSEPEMRSLLTTMKTAGHEALAHELFFDCFPELGSGLQMGGMKTTSLFRMALLYFLFVPDARERLLIRLRRLPERVVRRPQVHLDRVVVIVSPIAGKR